MVMYQRDVKTDREPVTRDEMFASKVNTIQLREEELWI